jgi:hypothetical protein
MKPLKQPIARFAVCIDNTGYPASLEPRKLYQILPDPGARAHGQMRVVDESGTDYLFPAAMFLTGVRFPWNRVREKSGKLFSRDAVLKLVWKTARSRAARKAPARGR